MPEERVDIVNKENEIIGSTTKSDAHANGLLHLTSKAPSNIFTLSLKLKTL